MMARNANVPFKGRIQKRKTCHLQIITFGLQRAAGPYRWATSGNPWCASRFYQLPLILDSVGRFARHTQARYDLPHKPSGPRRSN